jgi:hypothetical protein
VLQAAKTAGQATRNLQFLHRLDTLTHARLVVG